MANDKFSELSTEQIQKFAKTLSELRGLAGQLADATGIALEGEDKVYKRKMANQKKYFDAYTENLDAINKQADEEAAKQFQAFVEQRAKRVSDEKALNKIKQDLAEKRYKLELEVRKNNDGKLAADDVARIEKQLANEFNSRAKNEQELSALRKKYLEQELHDYELAALGSMDSRLATAVKTYENQTKAFAKELAEAQNQNPKLQENRQKEVGLRELGKTLSAELEAQNLLNTFNAEIAFAKTDEAGEYRSREANAKSETAALNELSAQKTDFRAQLDAEAMAKSGGILTPAEAKANAELAEKEFADVENRLAAIRKKNALAADPESAKLVEANEKKKAEAIAKYEALLRKKHNGEITAEQKQKIKDLADKEFELSEENLKKLAKEEEKNSKTPIISEDSTLGHIITGIKSSSDQITKDPEYEKDHTKAGDAAATAVALVDTAVSALSSMAAKLNDSIDKIASYQGFIDTRLQGSSNGTNYAGSYWGQLTKDMMSVGAITPFFKQEDFAENIKTLVNQGIAFDLKQRAFLMTIQEKIANTFNVADGTLLRLIRIQQEDSTAGRLGMESALNSFLNNMYETSEYLTDVAASVRGSLEEMESLMPGAEATEVEYQVQKWMGSLYSVGMSQEAVNSIASALGQLAAGQIEALTSGNGASNLIVMAANKAGIPISDILSSGLNASETNKLLQATVNYLAELAASSKDNNVVQQQLANVFGVKASDLKAATNLSFDGTTDNVYTQVLTYQNMLGQLNKMAGTMYQRTSIGEMINNVWANGEYTLASSVANSPVAYLIYKMAGLLESTTGGIPLPGISVFGNMVDLHTTVADLLRVGSLAGGIFGSLGSMISGLSSSFSGQAMLAKMGIESGSGLKITPRGNGISATESYNGNTTLSESGLVGNSNPSDIKDRTIQEAEDSQKQQMIEAVEEAEANQIDFINTNVLKIYELLDEVTSGKRNFNVKVAGYGLTSLGNNTALSGAIGGTEGVLNSTIGGNANSSTNSSTSSLGFGVGQGLDLGGWTMI